MKAAAFAFSGGIARGGITNIAGGDGSINLLCGIMGNIIPGGSRRLPHQCYNCDIPSSLSRRINNNLDAEESHPLFAASVPPSPATDERTTDSNLDGTSTATPYSHMPLTQILQLLNERNVRYAPDANRSELEELLQSSSSNRSASPRGSSHDTQPREVDGDRKSTFSQKKSRVEKFVDAVVIDEPATNPGTSTNGKGYQSGPNRYHQQQQKRRRHARSWGDNKRKTRRQEEEDLEREERRQQRKRQWQKYYQWKQYQSQQQQYVNRRPSNSNAYHAHDAYHANDIVDTDDFLHLSQNADDKYYENGLQIFLMGFMEAGKTATQLAVDAVNPFSGDDERRGGDWWYDERRGRSVLDVDILDYEPERKTRRRRPYSPQGTSSRRRRRLKRDQDGSEQYYSKQRASQWRARNYGRQETHQKKWKSNSSLYESNVSLAGERGRINNEDDIGELMNGGEELQSSSIIAGNKNTTAERQMRRRSRDEGGGRRQSYGLYQEDVERNAERNHRTRRNKQHWKDRLRHKFDAALGMQSDKSYYDSWKTNIQDIDDGRKKSLRQMHDRADVKDILPIVQAASSTTTESTSSNPKNNRRARMRAAKSKAGNIQQGMQRSQPKSSRSAHSASKNVSNGVARKSHLDEVPFWREGGTIASLLFDTKQPASDRSGAAKGSRRFNGGKSLERMLQSPYGHSHTVTSLFLYISRSTLFAFALLCKWAGVRGTIPQPIVVTAVVAMLLSARGGNRVLIGGLTMLALRLLGELLHGGLHGNEFWDDEYDYNEHDWKEGNSYR